MHHHTLSNLTPVEMIIGFAALFLVFIHLFLAHHHGHQEKQSTQDGCCHRQHLLGVTFVGWLVALLLATKQPQQVMVVYNTPSPPR